MRKIIRASWLFLALFLLQCGKKGTEPKPPPTPTITDGPRVLDVRTTSAEIFWKTDVPSYSRVYYGTSSGAYTDSVADDKQDTLHSVSLTGLQSNTVYYYVVASGNKSGETRSSEGQFTTEMSFSDLVDASWQAYENGDFPAAIQLFFQIIDENPYWADAHNGLGWCYSSPVVDSLDKALDHFNKAINQKMTLVAAYAGRGFVHLAKKKYAAAISDFKKVLELDSGFVFEHDPSVDSADVHLGLAEAYFYRQQFNLAQQQADILEPDNGLDPTDSSTWSVGGVLYTSYAAALLALIESLKTKIG